MKSLSQDLAEAAWVEPICRALAPHVWQDLRQELFIYCTVEHRERAEIAHANGCLEYFYLRCAVNYTRANGRINTLWQRGGQALEASMELQSDISDESREPWETYEAEQMEAVAAVYAGLDWYERKLIDLFLNGWSARKIYRETGITDKEVYRVIRLFKERVMKEL